MSIKLCYKLLFLLEKKIFNFKNNFFFYLIKNNKNKIIQLN
jgi:hypothetical protein